MKQLLTFIDVRFQFEGLHCWPEAPDEVFFLRNLHRHIFHVRARMNVSHLDREMEFILVKRQLEKYVKENFFEGGISLGRKSCEEMAGMLMHHIAEKYNRSMVLVEVSEDGENGAIMTLE